MRRDGAEIVLELDAAEAGILGSLGGQLATLLRSDAPDPALDRLLPDAYPDDPAAGAEFRHYTRAELAGRKADGADSLSRAVGGSGPAELGEAVTLRLDAAAADGWLRTLSDLRMTLAERIGIRDDADPTPRTDVGAVYAWLGELQWSLVDLLDAVDADEDGAPGAPAAG
jgi:hypothetical protein